MWGENQQTGGELEPTCVKGGEAEILVWGGPWQTERR